MVVTDTADMGMMGIFMPLILEIGIVLVGIYLFRSNSSQGYTKFSNQNTGLDILCERYARGEVDSSEYQSRKQDLEAK